jgi:hypothetical protein
VSGCSLPLTLDELHTKQHTFLTKQKREFRATIGSELL